MYFMQIQFQMNGAIHQIDFYRCESSAIHISIEERQKKGITD